MESRPTFAAGFVQRHVSRLAAVLIGVFSVLSSTSAPALEVAQAPLYMGRNVPGNLALVPSVEYPTIISQANIGPYDVNRAYMGYFDNLKCYSYIYNADESLRHFSPSSTTDSRTCSGNEQWSGNYLNWAATQTIDPFRLALTGGYRVRDTPTETWLEKARHDRNDLYPNRVLTSGVDQATPASWGSFAIRIQGLGNKMYIAPNVVDRNNNNIYLSGDNATPYDPGKHTLVQSNDGAPVVMDNSGDTPTQLSVPLLEVSVRVKVCDSTVGVEANCKQYAQGWKPEGLIQEYSIRLRYSIFGYLNDSGQLRDGGVLRAQQKFVGPTLNYPDQNVSANPNLEWDPITGQLHDNPDATDASASGVTHSGVINYLNRFGQMTTAQHKSLDPVSELYYTAVRYFKNLGNVPEYSNNATDTHKDGFPVITSWNDPIRYSCQANVILGIGDVYTHRDKNLPGATPADGEPGKPSAVSSDESVDVVAATQKVFELEGWNTALANPFTGRANSAYIAGLAYDSHTRDIRPDSAASPQTQGKQTLSTYWVDVRENQFLEPRERNQYWLAAKYGGFRVPNDYNPYTRTESLPQSWWHRSDDYLVSGLNGGTTTTVNTYPRPDNFYVAGEADKMVLGLRSAFESIIKEIIGSSGSFAANTTKLETGAMTYQSQFYGGTWRGDLLAYRVDVENKTLVEPARWSAAELLDTRPWEAAATGTRNIRYNSGSVGYNAPPPVFTGDLSSAHPGLSAAVVDYLRGDRSREGTGAGQLRVRQSVLGDIINSQPVFVGSPNPNLYYGASFAGATSYGTYANARATRAPVIYVGANDGMLHGFNATDSAVGGRETFAFVPRGALATENGRSRLARYTDQDYGTQTNPHKYFVDGEITVADVYTGSGWRTILVGTLGRGGRGVYALDVTDPASVTFLWEKSAADIPALGNVLGRPIIAQVANGDWRVLLGNGPNSNSGTAQLVMIPISGGAATVTDLGGIDNGLSGVNAWSTGATEFVDTVYAGDLSGALWKITNLTSTTPSATRLFQASYAGNTNGQPITVTPMVSVDPSTGKTWLFFGTGRYLNLADLTNRDVQTWYGVIDSMSATPATLGRDDLEAVAVGREVDIPNRPGYKQRIIAENTTLDTGKSGWYIDLLSQGVTAEGERMIVPNFFQGTTLIGTTRIPDSRDVCNPSGRGFVMGISPFTGGRLSQSFFDLNGDGEFDNRDLVDGVPVSGIGFPSGPNNPIFIGDVMLTNMDNATNSTIGTNSAAMAATRISWRELILD